MYTDEIPTTHAVVGPIIDVYESCFQLFMVIALLLLVMNACERRNT